MLTMISMDRDDGLAADPLNHAAAQTLIAILFDSIRIGCDDLELQTGAS